MAYGKIKADVITHHNTSTNQDDDVTVASIVATGNGLAAKAPINNPTFTGITTVPQFCGTATAVSALDIDCSTSNYFFKTINGNSTFTFSNVPASGVAYSFTLEITHTSGTITWPTAVKWPADTPPALTAGKTHLFMFVTDDGGTRWRGNALVDFTH